MILNKKALAFIIAMISIAVMLIWAVEAVGWTESPFLYAKDNQGEFRVSSLSAELSAYYKPAWKAGLIIAISLNYTKETGAIITSLNRAPKLLIKYHQVLFEMAGAILKEIPDLKQLAITYYVPIREVTLFLHPDDFKDEELHKKVTSILNKRRESKIFIPFEEKR